MNRLKGIIKKITSHEGISLVNIEVLETSFGTVVLDTAESCSYLRVEKNITVAFKETEVAIGLSNLGDLSMANQLACNIETIEIGKVLTKINLTCRGHHLSSIITSNSAKRLNLKVNDNVIALIKANEISLIEEN